MVRGRWLEGEEGDAHFAWKHASGLVELAQALADDFRGGGVCKVDDS